MEKEEQLFKKRIQELAVLAYERDIPVHTDFLTLNEFLINAKTTADLKLPSSLIKPSQEDLNAILAIIESVVSSGNLPELFNAQKFIL